MPPKRRHSKRLQSRRPGRPATPSDEQPTSPDNSKRRRTEPQGGLPAALITRTSPNRDTPLTGSRTELKEDEVLFLLGTATMRLRRERLRDAFNYFAKFSVEEFPKRFSLSCNAPGVWSTSWLLPSEEVNVDNDQRQDEALHIVEAHQTVLQLICTDVQTLRTSLKDKELRHWGKVALLLARYGATNSVKFDFGGYLLDAVVEKDLLRDHPWVMLEVGFYLKRKDYFRKAMMEVVRQYHTVKSDVRCLTDQLENSVLENVRKLEVRVQAVRMDILRTLSTSSNSSSMLASGIILQQLLQDYKEALFTAEPTDPAVYHALKALQDSHWERFEGRMVHETYCQLQRHDRMVSDFYDVFETMRLTDDDYVYEIEQMEQDMRESTRFGLRPVCREGQRMLQEISQHIDPIMDKDHSCFLVDTPTNYPWS